MAEQMYQNYGLDIINPIVYNKYTLSSTINTTPNIYTFIKDYLYPNTSNIIIQNNIFE